MNTEHHRDRPMSTSLLQTRRFLPLFLTQFLGALNDNIFKNALVVLTLYKAGESGPVLITLAGGLFMLPYALFSTAAGQLADRYEKARLIRLCKRAELVLMALAAAGFLLGSTPLLMVVLFGLGAQATFFSPLKYGILPDHLAESELVAGNALIEAGTFVGILIGAIAGGVLILTGNGPLITAAVGIIVALLGLVTANRVPQALVAAPELRIDWNPVRQTMVLVRLARQNRLVWLSVLGISWFWTIGATFLAEFPIIAKEQFGADGHVVTLLLTVFTIGIAAGSAACNRLLKGEVSARFVPFAALGLTVFTVDFAWNCLGVQPGETLISVSALLRDATGWRLLIDLFLVAACGGVYSVPLYAILQERSDPACRSRMIACNNIVNAVCMVGGAGVAAGLAMMGWSAPKILLLSAGINLLVSFCIARPLLRDAARSVMRWYFRVFHRAEIRGLENIALMGERSIVVANHLSFLDGCFIAAFLPDTLMFAIDTGQAKRFAFLRHFTTLFPVDSTSPLSTKAMIKAVREGRHLVIFPEGRISLHGALMKIYDGPGTIADKANATILPIKIDGLQFHKFSRLKGKVPQRWFPRFTMTILPPVTVTADPELRGKKRRLIITRQLQDLMTTLAFRPETTRRTLFAALLDARDRYCKRKTVAVDAQGNEATYGKLVLGAAVLGRKLAAFTQPGERVGVLLPNSVACLVTFYGLHAYKRVPAMMNFSVGADSLLGACNAATIKTIITSRLFIEKGKLDRLITAIGAQARVVYLEDVRQTIGLPDKLKGMVSALFARCLPGASSDPAAPAVVLFTSGSEGAPKGVVHSHRSILSNVGQVLAATDVNSTDRFFTALPLFHSFGLTAGAMVPLALGVRTFFYPSPLHYKLIPELVYTEQSTVLFGTDSFFNGYARMAKPLDFQSLRYSLAGAERVKMETRRVMMEKFQKPLYEGYGATECGPALSLSTPANFREGSVGRLLPGIEHRLEPIPGIDTGGRLFVRGPNLMLGYLRTEAPGVLEPVEEGWYDTGDIVHVDADGYLFIQGRVKRFAKIGGEMVSLTAAEGLVSALWTDSMHAVVSLPDPRKGEQLVLLTTNATAIVKELLDFARQRGVAEIMVPRAFSVVDKLPLLGTGKIDYPGVQRLAEAWAAGQKSANQNAGAGEAVG